jgi:hypothetical protein
MRVFRLYKFCAQGVSRSHFHALHEPPCRQGRFRPQPGGHARLFRIGFAAPTHLPFIPTRPPQFPCDDRLPARRARFLLDDEIMTIAVIPENGLAAAPPLSG